MCDTGIKRQKNICLVRTERSVPKEKMTKAVNYILFLSIQDEKRDYTIKFAVYFFTMLVSGTRVRKRQITQNSP